MRLRRSDSARLTHVATIGEPAPTDRSLPRRLLTIVAMTGVILGLFFAGRHWSAKILAAHWQKSHETVPDDRVEILVASAARLGRPGLPVLVAALGSPRENIASAGRSWLDRQLRSWENLSNQESQRNVAALAEALASELEVFSPAARLDAARLANRLLRWRLDGEIVDRGRFTWLCDRVLLAADYTVVDRTPLATQVTSAEPQTQSPEVAQPVTPADGLPAPRPLEIPELPQEDRVRGRFAFQVGRVTAPNVVPLPSVDEGSRSNDLADAWAMQGHRLGASPPQVSERKVYPSTRERVLVPSSPDGGAPAPEPVVPIRDMSLSECMHRLHDSGLESMVAETELKRRGFDALRLSIARRVYHPDRHMRLQLVRDLPGIPGIGATDWLITMAGDEDEEVRLAAITLLATVGDPGLLAQVESIARNDSAERIRLQAERLAKRRQILNR